MNVLNLVQREKEGVDITQFMDTIFLLTNFLNSIKKPFQKGKEVRHHQFKAQHLVVSKEVKKERQCHAEFISGFHNIKDQILIGG